MESKRLSHKPLEIPEDNPFLNCKLEREQYADVLTNIVENYSDGFVLAIDNGWGHGKTTFIKMWQQKLKNEEFSTLYFNAWENDFQDEVILALISELSELRDKSKRNFDDLVGKTAKFMSKVAPAAIKGAAAKLVGDEAISEVIKAGVEFTTDEVESSLKEIKERKKGILEFRETLQKFAEGVDDDKPIVFFIDELDRCRPNYSVKILEKIKHFFNVPGIVFVLSIDKEQLCYAIKGVYGSENFDAKEYLTRFIDLEYTIPKPNDEEVIRYYFEYYGIHDFYRQEKRRLGDLQYEFKDLVNSMRFLILSKSPSLRDLEKIISHLKIYVSTFGEKQFTFPEIAVVIILLKRFNVSLLQKIAGKDIKPHELVKKLEEEYRILPGNEEEQKRYLSFVFGTFLYTYCQYLGDVHSPRELVRIENSRYNLSLTTNYDQSTFEAYFTNRINNMNINDIGLDWIMKRIDLTEKLRNSSTQ